MICNGATKRPSEKGLLLIQEFNEGFTSLHSKCPYTLGMWKLRGVFAHAPIFVQPIHGKLFIHMEMPETQALRALRGFKSRTEVTSVTKNYRYKLNIKEH